jgi:hypothetical protein
MLVAARQATAAIANDQPSLPPSAVPSGETQLQSFQPQASVVALPRFVALDRPRVGDVNATDRCAFVTWAYLS